MTRQAGAAGARDQRPMGGAVPPPGRMPPQRYPRPAAPPRTGGSVILPGISGSGSSLSPGPVFLLTCVRPSRGRALVRERGSGVVAR